MKRQQIARTFLMTGVVGVLSISPVLSQELPMALIPQLEEASRQPDERKNPQQRTCCAADLAMPQQLDFLAQTRSLVQVTNVRLNSTEGGLEIILETPLEEPLQPVTRSEGNSAIAEIQGAQLRLPSGNSFRQENPAAGITQVSITNQGQDRIQVRVTGEQGVPQVKVSNTNQGIAIEVTPPQPAAQEEEELEIVVTGENDEDEGYNPSNASTATRTDTPLRDIPQSIQVVPQQVLEDQGTTQISDALRNVSGVTPRPTASNSGFIYDIRGFEAARTLRNGFDVETGRGTPSTATLPNTIERVEVLKGPASVLYGTFEPGGVVNLITKQPLSDPFYEAKFTAGQFSFYEPAIDLSGPLTDDKRLLYRFNASYRNFGSFVDFVNGENISIFPILRYNFSETSSLTLAYEYSYSEQVFYEGLPEDPVLFDIPINRFLNDPDGRIDNTTHTVNLTLDHQFDDNLSLRSAFGSSFSRGRLAAYRDAGFDPENNSLSLFYRDQPESRDYYSWQNDLTVKFNTGPIQHQLLAGIELTYRYSEFTTVDSELNSTPIDIFNPVYFESSIPPPEGIEESSSNSTTVGVYLQNQVTLLSNLKLLVGGRYDFIRQRSNSTFEFIPDPSESGTSSDDFYNEAFSPRVGIVYQPIEPISLYASFSQSFVPNNTLTREGDLIEPTRGTQYEVGIKADLTRQISATLSAYQITKTNILTEDPEDPDFSIPIGEVRSRGIELDVGGEILPGWNIIASAFLNESIVTEGDELTPEGDTTPNSPETGASLWTTYEIQQGDLQGLGFGFGLFYVGDREVILPNDFVLPSYVRADASLFYRRENWDVQFNIRNLFDTEYYEDRSGGNVFPGAPFTITGTVSVRF
jgi:iron complex outermembrane recepter protein